MGTDPTSTAEHARVRIDRDRARRAFDAYVGAYDAANPRIKLKIDHTYRVAQLCERIARSLELDERDVDLAWLCGLLHDIGRFEQVRRYDTFSDGASVSHAALGIDVLFGETPALDAPATTSIRAFVDSDACDELIRTAIATHSGFRLPADLDEHTRLFCDILRDADKIDIMNAVCLEPVEAIFGVSEGQIDASELSPAVVAAFDTRRTVRRDERRHPADYVVGFACFVFELVYPESRRAAREQGRVFELLDRPFTNAQTAREIARMTAELHAWLDDRCEG
ncbi:MAG: HD domain-containing protein [Coriobacteriia bacterium]|nr:HD domain-containing protein [Coriobacteriia bacterium]MBS5479237.1 HD domain-containing protein [Coriobacteriia bacterium]